MGILITLATLAIIGLTLIWTLGNIDAFELVGFLMSVFGTVFFFMLLVMVPIHRMSVESNIAEFREVRQTAERMRGRDDTWEAAAFQTKVADRNAWLASTKYYNDTVFDLWIPDEVENLKPIE